MPIGPGKYDDLCTAARLAANAKACILIIIRGNHGEGFAVQSTQEVPPAVLALMLRTVADEIEKSPQTVT